VKTNKGKRDRALLALLVGCGLRRQELAGLRIEDIQQRDGRWCIVDLAGKGNRIRTVPMPSWAKAAVDEWLAAAGFSAGPVLGAVNKGDRITGQGMSAQSIYESVDAYGNDLGASLAPHDVRRTFAKLAHKGRAPLEQIQIALGVMDPKIWTQKWPSLRWWAALKMEESQCPERARVTRPA
jgi:integrase